MRLLEVVVHQRLVDLILPQMIVDEFARNRDKTLRTSAQRMTSALRGARDVVEQVGSRKDKRLLAKRLKDFGQKVPLVGNTPLSAVTRIEALFAASAAVPVNESVKLRAANRAIEGKAPCHSGRNSINDAVLIEMYADALSAPDAKSKRFMFVSKNKADFGDTDERKPHADIAEHFSRMKSRYFTGLKDALTVIDPMSVSEIQFNGEDWEEPRVLSEILEAQDDLYWKIWYNRNAVTLQKVELGMLQVVEREPERYAPDVISKGSIKIMQDAMKRVVTKRGKSVKGPWTDFEWGMLNGKLSALRWTLGSEWDFLDT